MLTHRVVIGIGIHRRTIERYQQEPTTHAPQLTLYQTLSSPPSTSFAEIHPTASSRPLRLRKTRVSTAPLPAGDIPRHSAVGCCRFSGRADGRGGEGGRGKEGRGVRPWYVDGTTSYVHRRLKLIKTCTWRFNKRNHAHDRPLGCHPKETVSMTRRTERVTTICAVSNNCQFQFPPAKAIYGTLARSAPCGLSNPQNAKHAECQGNINVDVSKSISRV